MLRVGIYRIMQYLVRHGILPKYAVELFKYSMKEMRLELENASVFFGLLRRGQASPPI